MENFFKYFFGAGDPADGYEFKNFSLAHFLPIVVAAVVIYLVFRYRKQLFRCKYEDKIRLGLAFTLIITEMSYYWRLVGVPSLIPNPYEHLPITVCGWVIVFGSFLLPTKNQTLFDICYFWVFAGTIFALITPTVINYTGPTRFRYYQFWLEHLLGYLAVFYMIFVHKMRPTIKSMIKAYSLLVVLGFVAIFANNLLEGYPEAPYPHDAVNYLFMAKGEAQSPILEILPDNYVLRVITMAAAVGLLFFVSYLPWLIMDIKRKKRLEAAGASPTQATGTQLTDITPKQEAENNGNPTPVSEKSTETVSSHT